MAERGLLQPQAMCSHGRTTDGLRINVPPSPKLMHRSAISPVRSAMRASADEIVSDTETARMVQRVAQHVYPTEAVPSLAALAASVVEIQCRAWSPDAVPTEVARCLYRARGVCSWLHGAAKAVLLQPPGMAWRATPSALAPVPGPAGMVALARFRFIGLYDTAMPPEDDPDTRTGKEIRTLQGHSHRIYCMQALSPTLLLSAGDDPSIFVWDLTHTERPLRKRIDAHSDTVLSLAALSELNKVVSASRDGSVRVWDIETGTQCNEVPQAHKGGVRVVAAVPGDDNQVFSAGFLDKYVKLYDLRLASSVVRKFEGTGTFFVRDLAVTHTNHHLAVATYRSNVSSPVKLFDIRATQREEMSNWDGHTSGITSMTRVREGMLIATTSNDGTARVWNSATGAVVSTLRGHHERVRACAVVDYHPNQSPRLVTSSRHMVQVWHFSLQQQRSVGHRTVRVFS